MSVHTPTYTYTTTATNHPPYLYHTPPHTCTHSHTHALGPALVMASSRQYWAKKCASVNVNTKLKLYKDITSLKDRQTNREREKESIVSEIFEQGTSQNVHAQGGRKKNNRNDDNNHSHSGKGRDEGAIVSVWYLLMRMRPTDEATLATHQKMVVEMGMSGGEVGRLIRLRACMCGSRAVADAYL